MVQATMNQANRVHKGKYDTPRWGGTMIDVLALMQLASSELAKRSDGEAPPTDGISVFYNDGHARFTNVEQFAEAVSDIDISKVETIHCALSTYNQFKDRVTLSFGFLLKGLSVEVESTDRIWAHGLPELLSEQARKGELPEHSDQRRPRTWWEWICLAVLVCGNGAWLIPIALGESSVSDDLFLVWVIEAVILLAGAGIWGRRIKNPTLKLLAEGTDPSAEEEPKPLLSVRVQHAIRKRPVLSVTLSFLFAVAASKVSTLI